MILNVVFISANAQNEALNDKHLNAEYSCGCTTMQELIKWERNPSYFPYLFRGVKDVLKKRLKNYYKKQKLMQKESVNGDSYYDYICIVDFEATCEEGNPPEFIHEIIEFPVVLLNTHTLEIVSDLIMSQYAVLCYNFFASESLDYFLDRRWTSLKIAALFFPPPGPLCLLHTNKANFLVWKKLSLLLSLSTDNKQTFSVSPSFFSPSSFSLLLDPQSCFWDFRDLSFTRIKMFHGLLWNNEQGEMQSSRRGFREALLLSGLGLLFLQTESLSSLVLKLSHRDLLF